MRRAYAGGLSITICVFILRAGAMDLQTTRPSNTAVSRPRRPGPAIQVVTLPGGAGAQSSGAGWSAMGRRDDSGAGATNTGGMREPRDKSSRTLTTKIGLVLDCGAGTAGRLAAMRAFLDQSEPGYKIVLDGVSLTRSAQVMPSPLTCGAISEHSLEVHVPTAAAAPISPSLNFEVTLQ